MKQKKILIAGYEIGGQMQLLAEAFRRKGFDAESVAFNQDFRQFKTDKALNIQGKAGQFRRFLFFLKALFIYDVFYFFWGISLWGFWRFHGLDLPILKLFEKKIIVHFRGTDVVNIQYYENLAAPFQNKAIDKNIPLSRPDQLQAVRRWEKYADFILVSTPDLLWVSPRAILSPQLIRFADWQKLKENQSGNRKVFTIAHAPTRRHAKGTEFVIQAIDQLKSEGIPIELILLENIPYADIPVRLAQCDVGIDQLLHGWYGKVSVELMALGKPVICFINEAYKQYMLDLPIINATPHNLTSTLRRVIQDDALRLEAGKQGAAFTAQHHDVDTELDKLVALFSLRK